MKVVRLLVVVGLAVVGLAECDPLPSVTFTVTTTTDGADVDPGDGTCEMTEGMGDCSVRAAVDEANGLGVIGAPGGVDISVPVGYYELLGLEITSVIRVEGAVPLEWDYSAPSVRMRLGSVHIADGASLSVESIYAGYASSSNDAVKFSVDGQFTAWRSRLGELGTTIVVSPTGRAWVKDSLILGAFSPHLVSNSGILVLEHVDLKGVSSQGMVHTAATGHTSIRSSVMSWVSGRPPGGEPVACIGEQPTSLGYNAAFGTTCAFTEVGDLTGVNLVRPRTATGEDYLPGSPAVDRVPVGTAGCGDVGQTDLFATARPIDGNGDGLLACDIGMAERPVP